MPDTFSITATVVNRLGLHARPAMSFVDLATTFKAEIRVRKGDTEVNGKSIMEMMMLAASKGSELEVRAEGEDCRQACEALRRLVDSGFDED